MIVDANLLLYAADNLSPHHAVAVRWLEATLGGHERIGIPWQTAGAFVRISTHPRISRHPLSPDRAWGILSAWLAQDSVWMPPATEITASLLGDLVRRYHITGNLVPDAQLAALAIEHGLELISADTDFARFKELRWRNPLA